MKKITQNLRWLVTLLTMIASVGAWAEETTVLWQEDFSSYSKDDVPSGGTYSYVCTNGGSTTKIYTEALAGGESPELLVSKGGGTFTATIPLNNVEGDLTLTFTTNKQEITVSTTTEGITGSLKEKQEGTHTCTFTGVTTSMTEIVIVFTGSGSSNVRLDDIQLVKGTIPAVTKTLTSIELSGTYPTTFQQGDAFSHNGMTVTATYDDESTANVTSKASFSGYDMSSVGEQTVTVSYSEGEVTETATYTITVNEKEPVATEDGVFDFTIGNDYGTGLSPTSDGSYIESNYTWTAGNVTLVTSGKYRWWNADGTIRVYAPSNGNTTLTLSVPNGYVITNIVITGNSDCKTLTANPGDYSTSNGYVWTGNSQTVVFSRGDKNAQIKTITVTYAEGTSDPIDIATINSLSPTEVEVGSDGTFTVDVTLAEGITAQDYGISFISSDEDIIYVDANTGEYLAGDEPGTATITVRVDAADENTYNNVEKEFTVTVKQAATPQSYTLTITPNDNAEIFVYYNDPDNNYPDIQSGDEVLAGSEVLVSISADEENGYQFESVTVTDGNGQEVILTDDIEGISWTFIMPESDVTVSCTVKEVEPSEELTFVKVTSTDDLVAGGEYIIVGKNNDTYYAMSAQKNNNRGAVEISVSGSIATISSSEVQVITLEEDNDGWNFYTGELGYLYAAASNNNYLRTETTPDENGNAKATIVISSDGDATIVFQGNYTRNNLRFNNSNTIFSCYASTSNMPLVQLYKKVEAETTPSVTIGDSKWATYVAEDNVTFPSEVSAYTVETIDTENSKVALGEVIAVKKGTPILVYSETPNTYTLEVVAEEDCEETFNNQLKVSDGTVTGGATIYVLAQPQNSEIGFYPLASNVTIPAGKAYLEIIESKAPVKGFFALGDVADAINNILVETANGNIFNIAGQKVQNITKGGLYIVNGKKVFVK